MHATTIFQLLHGQKFLCAAVASMQMVFSHSCMYINYSMLSCKKTGDIGIHRIQCACYVSMWEGTCQLLMILHSLLEGACVNPHASTPQVIFF